LVVKSKVAAMLPVTVKCAATLTHARDVEEHDLLIEPVVVSS
jgi:hypothetical protein